MLEIFKELAVSEDLELGFGPVSQTRDIAGVATPGTYTRISSVALPAKKTDGSVSTTQEALDEKLLESKAVTDYAKIAGDATQLFEVLKPTNPNEAANKLYVDEEIVTSHTAAQVEFAKKTNVLGRDNVDIYTPTKQYHPATKLYVDQKVVSIGAGDMAKATYDKTDSGIVDNAEAIGGIKADSVMLVRADINDADIITLTGIYHGKDIANSPITGEVMVEAFEDATGIVHQRLVGKDNADTYTRTKLATGWEAWVKIITTDDLEDTNTSTATDKAPTSNQLKLLSDKVTNIKSVPVGTIIMYHGQLSNLDVDWKFCDGAPGSGTPDLRDMFILGAADELDIGNTGGTLEATLPAHTHTANHAHSASADVQGQHAHSATHNHTATTSSAGAHTHTVGAQIRFTGAKTLNIDTRDVNANYEGVATTSSNGNHTHTVSVATKSFNTGLNGKHVHAITVRTASFSTGVAGGTAGDNRPPYYKLAYIMKIA